MMGSQQATLFDGAFDRPSTPKKKDETPKEPPKEPPKAKNMKLSDFF